MVDMFTYVYEYDACQNACVNEYACQNACVYEYVFVILKSRMYVSTNASTSKYVSGPWRNLNLIMTPLLFVLKSIDMIQTNKIIQL